MEPVRLWAAVEFTARSGSTEALLTAAARAGVHLYGVTALPGGFCGHCAARQYPRLAALARRYRVRLRVRKKQGLYFRVRPLLRRAGLWAGLAVFLPLLLWTQQFVWFADVSTLTAGQAARASAVLREVGLQPGSAVTEAKLAAGEYALLHSGEFSWASLNFAKGRLEVEAAAAKPRHCRRDAARHPGPMQRHCGAHEPCQRHHAGGARAAGGSRTGPHWHGAQ